MSLRPIPPRVVKGLGGLSVAAVGIGNIHLQVKEGASMLLEDALFISNATIHLISVSSLAAQLGVISTFNNDSVKLVDKSTGTTIVQGSLIPNQCLYSIDLNATFSDHHALITRNAADLETWHRRLGHASFQTIITMAKTGLVPGMPSTFTSMPPKCDSCILGKQTKNAVPKVRKGGRRATRKLEIVWVDLTGPQAVVS